MYRLWEYTILNKGIKGNMFNVYRLLKDKEIVYIGKTINLQRRVEQHLLDKDFDEVQYCCLDSKEDMDSVESVLIYQLIPKLNKKFEKYSYVLAAKDRELDNILTWVTLDTLPDIRETKINSMKRKILANIVSGNKIKAEPPIEVKEKQDEYYQLSKNLLSATSVNNLINKEVLVLSWFHKMLYTHMRDQYISCTNKGIDYSEAQETLAKILNCSERNIRDGIKVLNRAGMISISMQCRYNVYRVKDILDNSFLLTK